LPWEHFVENVWEDGQVHGKKAIDNIGQLNRRLQMILQYNEALDRFIQVDNPNYDKNWYNTKPSAKMQSEAS